MSPARTKDYPQVGEYPTPSRLPCIHVHNLVIIPRRTHTHIHRRTHTHIHKQSRLISLNHYRDIKPENILLDEAGHPYLTDFGISHIMDQDDTPCFLSSGTRQYIAPEVFTRNHAHGVASDFWSLGVVSYELLFQRRPFEKNCPLEFIEFAESASLHDMACNNRPYRSPETTSLHRAIDPAADSSPGGIRDGNGRAGIDLKNIWHNCTRDPFFGTLMPGCPLDSTLVCDESYYGWNSDMKLPQHLRVPIPIYSRMYGELSSSCLCVLEGLLDVRHWKRWGVGNNFITLRNHKWFQEMNLSWDMIEMKKISPPFVPCRSAVSTDMCAKYVNSRPDKDDILVSGDVEDETADCDIEIQEALKRFYYVAERYTTKARPVSPDEHSLHSSLSKSPNSVATISATTLSFTTTSCAF